MPTSYTSLLGLALPVTGELSGTWGDTVNSYITQYVDAAVAGAQTISGSQTAVTLSVTNGASLTQAGSGSTGSAQYQIINCTGNPASALTVTVPSASKVYLVLNNTSTSQTVTVKGAATTGVTVAAARAALIAWNGTDFELVATDDASKMNGVLAAVNGGTGQSSYAVGDILYASTTTALSKLADVATGNALISGGVGVAPSYGKIGLTTHVSGTLPIGNGGTGVTGTPSNGQLLIGNGTGYTVANLTQGSGVTITNSSGGITIAATGTGGTVTSVSGTGTVNGITLSGTVTSSGSLTLGGTLSGVSLTTQVSGTLPIANGGTNATATPTGGAVAYGTGTAYAFTSAGTSGQVLTSAGSSAPTWTTATNANTASAIVQRDASGNFSAGTITATLSGTATQVSNNLTLATSGTGLSGSATFNGSSAQTFTVTSNATSANTASTIVARDASGNFSAGTITAALSGNASTATTATQVSNSLTLATSGTGLTGSATFNGSSAQTFTVTSNATSANTASTIVARDGSGNFSAGTITATLSGNATNVSGTVAVANGGTGATSLTANNFLLGNGTSAVTASSLLQVSGSYVRPVAYADTVVAAGNTGTALTLTCTQGNVFTATLTGNATITLSSPIATGATSITLILTNDATAGRTVAWAGGSFVFPGGAASLSRTTTAGAVDVWVFFTPNGGTTWYGNIAMKNMTA